MAFYILQIKSQKKEIKHLRQQIEDSREQQDILTEMNKLLPKLKAIARLDHDVNTPLCVITMSLGRAKKLGQEMGDETLLHNVEDIMSAVSRIGEIMQAVRVLKTSKIISYKDKQAAETKTGKAYEH